MSSGIRIVCLKDVVPIKIQDKALIVRVPGEGNKMVMASTRPPFDNSRVSTSRASADPTKQVTFATNVAGHEAGHQTLPEEPMKRS